MVSDATKNVGIRLHNPKRRVNQGDLLKERLHLVEEAVALCVHRHAAFLGELREQFLLTGGQLGGNLNLDDEQLFAGRLALQTWNAETFETEGLIWLRAGRHLHHRSALKSRDFDLASEYCRDEIDRH